MMENMSIRILDILNLPLMHRCPELGLIIDRASLKELQEIFPVLINSIFGLPGGSVGWGLRTTQQAINHQEFEILYNFFIPLGPMFRLLYRLLSDPIKFDVPLGFLPPKMQQMLESGRYPGFYSDIITIDPFRRQIVSLALNAFDFFFIHFVTHGTLPLHKMYPTAAQLNSEKARTVYFYLAADYLCTFLPSKPDTVIQPQNIGTIKLPTVAPAPNIQPITRPKYLLLSAISNHSTPTQNPHNARHIDSSRANIWRSETVLYLFVDAWLRSDFDEHRDLPSNEFVRLVRVLVKQLHAFGNSVNEDSSALQGLRQTAAPLMNSKMYAFIKSLISRWPLDSSFADVLELWLSFIQPWRYVHNRDLNLIAETPVPPRFEPFIAENLVVLTQIFVKLVPRFERIDLSTYKNVFMLFRVLKVFGQSNLADILRKCENGVGTNVISANYLESAVLQSNSFNNKSGDRSPNRSGGGNEWRPYSRSENLDETYVPLFAGDFMYKLEELTRKILVVKHIARNNLKEVEEEYEKKHRGLLGFLKSIFTFEEDTALTQVINDRKKIPEILDFCGQSMRGVFDVNVPEPSMTEEFMDEFDSVRRSSEGFNMSDKNMSEFSDINFSITPSFMKSNAKTIKYGGDPALLPIRDSEVTFLVRFLHQLSCKLNLMFPHEIHKNWHRSDVLGRLTRQLLLPPMVSQTFDKSTGLCILKKEDLPPRICLRPLASFKTLTFVIISQILSYLLWGAPSYGLFLLILFAFFMVFVRAFVADVPTEAY